MRLQLSRLALRSVAAALPVSMLAITSVLAQVQAPVQIPRTPPVTVPDPGAPPSPSIQGTWQWQSSEYGDDSTVVVADPSRYTVAFLADGRLGLRADCNQGSGTYTLNGAELTLQLGPMTLIACAPPSQDSVFLRDLAQVATYVFDGEQLVLNMRLDTGNMIFSRQPPLSLSGSDWRVQSYNNGRGGVVTVLPDTQLTLSFDAAGRASGNTGCNTFMGTYTLSESSLSFGPLAMTRRACLSDAANAQEQEFVAALAATTAYDPFGDRLTLRGVGGTTQVVLVRPMP